MMNHDKIILILIWSETFLPQRPKLSICIMNQMSEKIILSFWAITLRKVGSLWDPFMIHSKTYIYFELNRIYSM